MLLAVNVGNKNISFAVFDGISDEPGAKFKISSDFSRTDDEYAIFIKQLRNSKQRIIYLHSSLIVKHIANRLKVKNFLLCH